MNKYLTIRDLNVAYYKNNILENVNLDLYEDERIAIIGKNGAGKTTLIEAIMGTNNAIVKGYLKFENEIEKNIKTIFQTYDFDRDFNLLKLYRIYMEVNGLKPEKDYNQVFEKYDLAGLEKKKFHKLSGGQKQKFKLMMCLELKPKLLILDEITTALDYQWRQEILKILKNYLDLNPGCALILVSHDLNEILTLTEKQYIIEDKTLKRVDNIRDHFKMN